MPIRTSLGLWIRLQRIVRRVARGSGTPEQIALGVALGVFVAFTPTVGLQMIIAAGLATLLHANRLAAVLPVWITNPVTVIPIYCFNYWIGRLVMGGPKLREFRAEIADVIRFAEQAGIIGVGQTVRRLLGLGMEFLGPLWLGSVAVGALLALPTYLAARRAVIAFRARLHKRRNDRASRLLERAQDLENEKQAAGEGVPPVSRVSPIRRNEEEANAL